MSGFKDNVRIVATGTAVRDALAGDAPGLVPTMGGLHDGHLALIRRSAAENRRTVVSVFVNPTQFDDPTDLARYPRDLSRDAALAAAAGADLIFAPSVEEVYPPGFATGVEVAGLDARWEGASRPGHFRGVATVVTILLNLIRPARSYFGEKDYQQLLVVRRLHADLALPGEIVACPTVRDADGLALSSRNARLSVPDRRRAAVVPRALGRMAAAAAAGETDPAALIALGQETLAEIDGATVEYLAVVDGDTLEPLSRLVPGARALVAVRLGDVRLIDNVALATAPTWAGGTRAAPPVRAGLGGGQPAGGSIRFRPRVDAGHGVHRGESAEVPGRRASAVARCPALLPPPDVVTTGRNGDGAAASVVTDRRR